MLEGGGSCCELMGRGRRDVEEEREEGNGVG